MNIGLGGSERFRGVRIGREGDVSAFGDILIGASICKTFLPVDVIR